MPTITETFCKEDADELKELFNEKLEVLRTSIEGNKKLNDANFGYIKESTELARKEMNERLLELNDVRLRFLPRQEYDARHDTLVQRIEGLEKVVATNSAENKGRGYGWATIMAAVAALGAIIALILNSLRLIGKGL